MVIPFTRIRLECGSKFGTLSFSRLKIVCRARDANTNHPVAPVWRFNSLFPSASVDGGNYYFIPFYLLFYSIYLFFMQLHAATRFFHLKLEKRLRLRVVLF